MPGDMPLSITFTSWTFEPFVSSLLTNLPVISYIRSIEPLTESGNRTAKNSLAGFGYTEKFSFIILRFLNCSSVQVLDSRITVTVDDLGFAT